MKRDKPIGSEFYLTGIGMRKSGGPDAVLHSTSGSQFSSGRAALRAALRAEGLSARNEAILPIYACRALSQPFNELGIPVSYYSVGRDLRATPERLDAVRTERTRVAVIVHYFGFPQDVCALKEWADQNHILLIEDCAQALFSTLDGARLGTFGDYGFYSLRKFLPIPDGGVLHSSHEKAIRPVEREMADEAYSLLRMAGLAAKSLHAAAPALFGRAFYDRSFELENRAARRLDENGDATAISVLSRELAMRINAGEVIEKRRANFEFLLHNLPTSEKWLPFFTELPLGICPFGFPLVVEDKTAVKDALVRQRIYPSTQWFHEDLPEVIGEERFAEERAIPDRMLTLPIDQRYDIGDMERIVEVFAEETKL